MANRSNIMGLHGLKNKTSRNSFDLSHRNLFTAKVGELLPCFVQEVNPGDSIKLDSSYFTRTAPLQTAAFTRLRENVQYFFVPYQCLWKYFEGQVKNMTKNANGGDVSQIAKSPFANAKVSTEMPYISYSALHSYVNTLVNGNNPVSPTPEQELGNHTYINGCYRFAETAKLLQMLGYGNFNQQFEKPHASDLLHLENVKNSPALSVFRLLAYQKVCNDFYIYRQWQPYNASLCNIDYITPDSPSMDLSPQFTSQLVPGRDLDHLNMLDMRFSNLPLDYFNGVLPTPQFGSESVVNLNLGEASGTASISGYTGTDMGKWSGQNATPSNSLVVGTPNSHVDVSNTQGTSPFTHYHDFSATANFNSPLSGQLSIAAFRQAITLQKYKEIQLANDSDFVSQIEAHFGVTPKHSDTVSYFLGGASSMIDINPQINSNLADWSQSNAIKAAPLGQGRGKIKFTADTYGIVLGIYRCVPVLDYAHVGVDRTLLKTDASDFVIPELDSIGMQQSVVGEIVMPSFHDGFSSILQVKPSTSYGYAPRYSEYKTSFDRYNGEFCYSLNNWVTGLNLTRLRDLIFSGTTQGTLVYRLAPELFNCRPDLVKSIFLNQKSHLTSDDNLFVGLVNMAYVIRRLSRYGLPYSG